jgi:hypothetical protein
MGGFSGDGGPATAAKLDAVETPDGGLLILDTGINRVRRVSPAGMIATVAGIGGWPGSFSGDGGLATLAGLNARAACGDRQRGLPDRRHEQRPRALRRRRPPLADGSVGRGEPQAPAGPGVSGRSAARWKRSRERLQPGAGQSVGGSDRGSFCAQQIDDRGARELGGERLAELLGVLRFGAAAAGRVGLDGGPAEGGQRRESGSTAVKVMPRPARSASSRA